jgi:hypothetical protein
MRLFWPFRRRRVAQDLAQLGLELEPPPRDAQELLQRLRQLGLSGIDTCRLTRNRSVLVSFRGARLRIHEGYLTAPDPVLRTIVDFVNARSRRTRRVAGQRLAMFPLPPDARRREREVTHPDDLRYAERLAEWHARYNARHFGGMLRPVPIRISRRMKARLGHYAMASESGPAEIVIGRRHLRRHGWDEALHTLLHEMVHQWQDETGQPIDHGRGFRRKCREIGITPSATRGLIPHAEFQGLTSRSS